MRWRHQLTLLSLMHMSFESVTITCQQLNTFYCNLWKILLSRTHNVQSYFNKVTVLSCRKTTNLWDITTTRGAQIKHISFHIGLIKTVFTSFKLNRILTSCAGCHGAFLFTKEALEHHDLTDANHNQEDGFPDGPISDALQEMLRLHSVLSLSESVPSL